VIEPTNFNPSLTQHLVVCVNHLDKVILAATSVSAASQRV
jgi:hypothetical protein